MLPRSCFLLLCWFLLSALGARGEELFLGVERSRIERVIEMGYNMDLGTEAEIGRLAGEYSESPVPGVLEAGYLYWMQNYQLWDVELMDRFEERSAAALKGAEAYLAEHREEPDARFAVAMVELMQVIYYVDHKRWWSAFWKSRSSLREMRRLNAEYPDYQDAKLPLGMHNCYMSRTPGYLKPLAFLMRFKGDWDLGIRFMQECRDGGLFCRVDAGYYLSAIRMELEGDRRASRDEMARLAERFPGNLKFRAMLAELERGTGNQSAAMSGALAVLSDEHIGDFEAIEGRSLVTLLWSSLASGKFELAMETAGKLEGIKAAHAELRFEVEWARFVRAESLFGLGRRAEALALWGELGAAANREVAAEAKKRLAAES